MVGVFHKPKRKNRTVKIAITSQGKELSSGADPRFGRAKWFIVVDTETGEFEAVDNKQILNIPQGAGIQAAQNVARLGVECVITGHCGPNAFRTLTAAGIKVIAGASGTVQGMIEKFKAGELKTADSADVEGEWL